jgi:hypothetical protein
MKLASGRFWEGVVGQTKPTPTYKDPESTKTLENFRKFSFFFGVLLNSERAHPKGGQFG